MLVVGAVFVDVKGFAQEKYRPLERNVGDIQVTAGGVCRNVAENLTRLGMQARFVSMVDSDAVGQEVRDSLAKLGVDVTHLIASPRGMGLWLAILDERGELAGSISRQPDFAALEAYLRENGDALMDDTDGVVVEFDMSESISELVMALAKRHGRPVYSIVGNMSVILRRPELLHGVSCFICNEMEAGRLFREDLTSLGPDGMLEALKRGSAVAGIPAMVITMGEHGAVYVDNLSGEFGYCPALPVHVVDTTGAGDAFFSAAVATLTRGEPLSQAVLEGVRLAARTLQVAGSCAGENRELGMRSEE